jgi:hypothetical protein
MNDETARSSRRARPRKSFFETLSARLALLLSGSDFVVRHGPGASPIVLGRLPASKIGAIHGFCTRDLGMSVPAFTILGTLRSRTAGGGHPMRLRFNGGLNAFQRQRVRNFFVELLR